MNQLLTFIGLFCGAFLGVVAVGTWLWVHIGKPAKRKADAAFDVIELELNSNGGGSIKDRIGRIATDAALAVQMAREAAEKAATAVEVARTSAESLAEHRASSREALSDHLTQSMEEHAAIDRALSRIEANTGGS